MFNTCISSRLSNTKTVTKQCHMNNIFKKKNPNRELELPRGDKFNFMTYWLMYLLLIYIKIKLESVI